MRLSSGVLILGIALGLFPQAAQAAWVQYDATTLAVTYFHPTRPPPTVPGKLVAEGTISLLALDGCPGEAVWHRVTSTTPLTLALRSDIACYRGQVVYSTEEVDRVVQQRIQELLNLPLVERVRGLEAIIAAVCAGGASQDCTDAQAARTLTVAQRIALRTLAQGIAALQTQAEAFKAAHPNLP